MVNIQLVERTRKDFQESISYRGVKAANEVSQIIIEDKEVSSELMSIRSLYQTETFFLDSVACEKSSLHKRFFDCVFSF